MEATMNFTEVLYRAKRGDADAFEELYRQYERLMKSVSWHDGALDEDLFQKLGIVLMRCIRTF